MRNQIDFCEKLFVISHFSEKIIFLVSLNGDIRGWVSNTGEDESVAHLLIIEEALVGLIHGTLLDETGTGAASSGSAGVRKVDTLLLGGVDDVLVAGNLELLLAVWGHESDGVLAISHGHDGGGSSSGLDGSLWNESLILEVALNMHATDASSGDRKLHWAVVQNNFLSVLSGHFALGTEIL